MSWQEARDIKEILSAEPDIIKLLSQICNPPLGFLREALINLIYGYLYLVYDKVDLYDEDSLHTVCSNFSNSLFSNSEVVSYLAPIYSFKFEDYDEPIRLSKECVIRNLTDLEWIKILENELINRSPLFHIPYLFAVVERPEPLIKTGMVDLDGVTELFNKCTAAIRLSVGGYSYTYDIFRKYSPGAFHYSRTAKTQPNFGVGMMPYSSLSTANLEHVLDNFNNLDLIEKKYPTAYSRFLSLSYRARIEDRIIDASIGLENILLSDSKDELRFKFALRGAWLTGEAFEGRMANFTLFKHLYDNRCDIAHGGKLEDTVSDHEPEIQLLADVIKVMLNIRWDGKWSDYLNNLVLGKKMF